MSGCLIYTQVGVNKEVEKLMESKASVLRVPILYLLMESWYFLTEHKLVSEFDTIILIFYEFSAKNRVNFLCSSVREPLIYLLRPFPL